jgi:dipeptidase E
MKRVLAIGGGGFLMEKRPSPIDAAVLRLTGKARPRICFVPTPSGDLPEHIVKFYATFTALRCEPSHLAFFRQPARGSVPLAGFRDHMLAQDVIYVGGGNTRSALAVWREWHVDDALAQAYGRGVLLAGMSAGAMCWFEAGLTDSFWDAGYRPLVGLGLLPGGCGVHYHSDPKRSARLRAALEASAVPPSVGIDDFAAVLFENELPKTVFSWAPNAGAYEMSWRDGRVVESALPVTPLADEM